MNVTTVRREIQREKKQVHKKKKSKKDNLTWKELS